MTIRCTCSTAVGVNSAVSRIVYVCRLYMHSDETLLRGLANQATVKHSRCALTHREHCMPQAAVKAIAWSPHQHGLLASGGGTADRCIRFWNTASGASLASIDTGSQVRGLAG